MRICDLRHGAAAPRGVLFAALLLCGSITLLDATAQSRSGDINGIVALRDWPEQRGDRARLIEYSEFRLLPFIDTLTVGYRFNQERGRPSMEFALEWAPGDEGIVNGRLVGAEKLPRTMLIESIELLATAVVDGKATARFYLPLDTLRLRPSPSVALVEIRDISWDAVFADTDSATTRQLFASGFALTDLRILRVVFATERPVRREPMAAAPEDDWTTVIVPDVDVWVSWVGRTRSRPPATYLPPAARDRRDEIGRDDLVDRGNRDRGYDRPDAGQSDEGQSGTGESDGDAGTVDGGDDDGSGRAARRKKSRGDRGGISLPGKKSKDDDDDEEDRLLPGALAGVAAIGALAVFGGTIGYSGTVDKAPIGLMAGRVGRRGGALFHVAINRQVFGKAPGPENLSVGVTGFMDVFRSRIQPAVGLGMRITEEGTTTTRTLPSLAVGLVANLDHVVLLAAYDIESRNVRVGLGINIRAILADE